MLFRKEFHFLSNFYLVEIKDTDGYVWPSSEHIFQALKSLNPDDWEIVRNHPLKGLKYFSRTLPLRSDWEIVKIDVMRKALKAKFSQHPELFEKLKNIKEEIIEHNDWHDNFWGSCICNKCKDKGENMLGKLLMGLRDGLLL